MKKAQQRIYIRKNDETSRSRDGSNFTRKKKYENFDLMKTWNTDFNFHQLLHPLHHQLLDHQQQYQMSKELNYHEEVA